MSEASKTINLVIAAGADLIEVAAHPQLELTDGFEIGLEQVPAFDPEPDATIVEFGRRFFQSQEEWDAVIDNPDDPVSTTVDWAQYEPVTHDFGLGAHTPPNDWTEYVLRVTAIRAGSVPLVAYSNRIRSPRFDIAGDDGGMEISGGSDPIEGGDELVLVNTFTTTVPAVEQDVRWYLVDASGNETEILPEVEPSPAAISYVGGRNGSGTSIAAVDGAAVGDRAVVIWSGTSPVGTEPDISAALAAGWTLVPDTLLRLNSENLNRWNAVMTKVISDPADAFGPFPSSSRIIAAVFRGVSTISPLHSSAIAFNGASTGTAMDFPGLGPPPSGAWAVRIRHLEASGATLPDDPALETRVTQSAGAGSFNKVALAAGAVSEALAAATLTLDAGSRRYVVALYLRPGDT